MGCTVHRCAGLIHGGSSLSRILGLLSAWDRAVLVLLISLPNQGWKINKWSIACQVLSSTKRPWTYQMPNPLVVTKEVRWSTGHIEKAKAGLRYAVVCPNVTERTKDRIAESKRARAGLFALVE